MLTPEEESTLFDVMTRDNIDSFAEYGDVYHQPKDHSRHYVFKRTPGAKVLAVAHTDWVSASKWKSDPTPDKPPRISLNKEMIFGRQLDDRLGVWILLHILPKLLPIDRIPYDILLTDDEEVGKSTASFFSPGNDEQGTPIQYNWMFEWDRHGDDVVMYSYECKELKDALRSFGFKPGSGSFTDICYLSHLKCKGMNFGCGYHSEHSDSCFCDLKELQPQLQKFIQFYCAAYNVPMPSNHYSGRSDLDKVPNIKGSKNRKYGPTAYDSNLQTHRGTVIDPDPDDVSHLSDEEFDRLFGSKRFLPSQHDTDIYEETPSDKKLYKLWQDSDSPLGFGEWSSQFHKYKEAAVQGFDRMGALRELIGEGETELEDWEIEQLIRYGDMI